MAAASVSDTFYVDLVNEALRSARDLFQSTRAKLGIAASEDAVQVVFSRVDTTYAKFLVMRLIIALQANLTLTSQSGYANFHDDLTALVVIVNSKDFDIKSAIPLVERVVNSAPTQEIYNAVSNLVAQTTPPALAKAVFDTPLRPSSASQLGIEQTHDEVDQRICEELTGRVFDNVGGFYERYFEGKSWTKKASDIYEESKAQYAEGRWSEWPEPSLEVLFFEWFMKFQDTVLSGLRRKYYTSANKFLRGSEANRKLDIFLAPTDAALPDGQHDWSNVLVIGEHKQNPAEDRATTTLVQLAGYVREVFGSQPERRFVPGFTICGSLMRLWVFDRSGLYTSQKFDIHKEPERFVKVLTGYTMMSDAELGLNTFIKRDCNGKYIVTRDMRISLEDQPIASTKAIVCRGTTCYRGRSSDSIEWEYVVKFAWPSDKRQREGELLKLAKERGVIGIAVWFNHEQITIDGNPDTISHFRRDMKFGTPRKLPRKASWVDSSLESSWAHSKASLRGRQGCGESSATISVPGQKRKRDERLDGGSRPKRFKFDGSHSSGTNTRIKEGELDAINTYSILKPVVDSLADCRNEWQRNNVDGTQEEEAGADGLTDSESETYSNRVHYCLITSPAGRPLHTYRSVGELLEALRDAIRGHRSLFEDGKILHRDISENNIIITELPTEGSPRGRLIDLDLAKELDSAPSGAHHRTGTMQFMAIEVLEGNGHTYRHDLESFFYVFVWICIRYGFEGTGRSKSTKTNILQNWYTGTYSQIAATKMSHVSKKRFETIIAKFSPQFESLKPLARDLRTALFPSINGETFFGTLEEHGIMYDGMLDAFSRAIHRLGEGEQAFA